MQNNSGKSIFNESAARKLRSPDDLEKYVRVTTPSVWMTVCACAALLLGLLVWGVFGTVSTDIATTGAVIEGQAMCFVPASDVVMVDVGDTASFEGVRMRISKVADAPMSIDEVKGELQSDYLLRSLIDGDWGYQVTFDGDVSELPSNVPLEVRITTERIAPISLILENRG